MADESSSAPLGTNPERPPRKQVLLPLALTPPFLLVAVSDPPALLAGAGAVLTGLLAGAALFEGLRLLNRVAIDERLLRAIAVVLIGGGAGVAYWIAPGPNHSLVVLGLLGTVWGITLEGLRVQLGHENGATPGA